MSLDYNKDNIILARNLRKRATKQEKHLWYDFLANHPIRFQRQKAIGEYIADFYCHDAKLVIELDGSQHYTVKGLENDTLRTEELEKLGLLVLRFTNENIDKGFDDICRIIDETIVNRMIGNKE